MSFLLPQLLLAGGLHKTIKKASSSSQSPQVYNVFNPGKHGKAYQDLANANPYMNVAYRQSWIQKLLGGLGFRTNKDAYLESMAQQAREYDAQISQKEFNESYDSPLAQVERERAAGLNPDLTGNISSGESQSLVDDGNPPIAPQADDLSIVQDFASGVLSGVQAAFGLAGSIQNLRSLRIDNESKMMSLVKDAFGMVLPEIYDEKSNSKSGEVNFMTYYDALKPHYGKTMSRKQFESFARRVNAFGNSAEGRSLLYAQQATKAKNRKSMFAEIADPDQYSEWDDVMYDIADELSSLAFDTQKITMSNQKTYQENLDPAVKARIDSNPDELALTGESLHQARNASDLGDYQRSIRSTFSKIMKDLDARADRGNKIAPIVKAVLSVWLMGALPNISFKR